VVTGAVSIPFIMMGDLIGDQQQGVILFWTK